MLSTALSACVAVLLDHGLGEPRRWHPLVGFGWLAHRVERMCYGAARVTSRRRRMRGILAVILLVIPLAAIGFALSTLPYAGMGFSVLTLYLALGHRSLQEHAQRVEAALNAGNEVQARALAGHMVSRDAATLDIPLAVTESVLENGNDGVFGALFWFAIGGAAGALVYRLVNTLDAMWGYRNQHYQAFGWAAARLDDSLNYIPARLTALTYAMLGHTRSALVCWRDQVAAWDSPNAGPVMAAGAGALHIRIGGPACYQGQWHQRPILGCGEAPTADTIERALALIRVGVWLWLAALLTGGWAIA